MTTFWSTLSRREKYLLLVAFLVVLTLLTYLLWLEPNYKQLNSLRQQVPNKRLELIEMKSRLKHAQPVLAQRKQNQRTSTSNVSLLTRIEESANKASLRKNINRIQPQQNGEVRVWLNDFYFDTWLTWTEKLKQENIVITSASVSRTTDNQVNIRATLKLN